jgi:hypothetical protein
MSTEPGEADKPLKRRLQRYEEIHGEHDRRISKLENFRLQAQGGLKVLAVVVGSGIIAYFL